MPQRPKHSRAFRSMALGTAGSFGIAIISTAIVARLFLPSAFGDLATFLAWVAVPAAIGGFRVSDAIPLTKSREDEGLMVRGALEGLVLVSTVGGAFGWTAQMSGVVLGGPSAAFMLGFAFVASNGVARIAVMFATKHGWFGWLATLGVSLPLGTLLGQVVAWCSGRTLIEGTVCGAALAATPSLILLITKAPCCLTREVMLLEAHAMYPEFGRLSVPFAVLSAIRARGPYLFMGLPSSGLTQAQAGLLQQAERIAGWPRSGLSAVMRPVFHHAASTDATAAAASALRVISFVFGVSAAPLTWGVLNADVVVRFTLGPGWEEAATPFRVLLIPAVVFIAADFTDRLFDMHRRQGVFLALETTACLLTLPGAYVFSVVWPSLLGLAVMMGAVMVGYALASLAFVGKFGGVSWRESVPAMRGAILSSGAVLVVQWIATDAIGAAISSVFGFVVAISSSLVLAVVSPSRRTP